MAYGIGQDIEELTELGVDELTRRQSIDPQLKYALALQEASNLVSAAVRERDMSVEQPQPPQVVGQLESSLAQQLMPGVEQSMQQQPQQPQQPQPMQQGINNLPAGNMMMAGGGIVEYANGGVVEYDEGGFLASLKNMDTLMNQSADAIQTKRLARGKKLSDYSPLSPYSSLSNIMYDTGIAGVLQGLTGYESEVQQPEEELRGALLPETETYFASKAILEDPETSERDRILAIDQLEGLQDAPMFSEMMQQVSKITAAREGNSGMAGGGVVSFAGPQGSFVGQNNPYNIRDYDQNWDGQSGATRGFVDFVDEASGVRAADKLLENYQSLHGITTVREAIARFAPPNENVTEEYIQFVANKTGFTPDQPIDLSDSKTRDSLLGAIGTLESNYAYDENILAETDRARPEINNVNMNPTQMEILAEVLEGAGGRVSDMATGAGRRGFDSASEMAREGFSSLQDKATQGFDSASEMAREGFSSLQDTATQGFDSANEMARRGISSLQDTATRGFDSAAQGFDSAREALINQLNLGVTQPSAETFTDAAGNVYPMEELNRIPTDAEKLKSLFPGLDERRKAEQATSDDNRKRFEELITPERKSFLSTVGQDFKNLLSTGAGRLGISSTEAAQQNPTLVDALAQMRDQSFTDAAGNVYPMEELNRVPTDAEKFESLFPGLDERRKAEQSETQQNPTLVDALTQMRDQSLQGEAELDLDALAESLLIDPAQENSSPRVRSNYVPNEERARTLGKSRESFNKRNIDKELQAFNLTAELINRGVPRETAKNYVANQFKTPDIGGIGALADSIQTPFRMTNPDFTMQGVGPELNAAENDIDDAAMLEQIARTIGGTEEQIGDARTNASERFRIKDSSAGEGAGTGTGAGSGGVSNVQARYDELTTPQSGSEAFFDMLKTLGGGAGRSKGFEFAGIAQEGAAQRAAESKEALDIIGAEQRADALVAQGQTDQRRFIDSYVTENYNVSDGISKEALEVEATQLYLTARNIYSGNNAATEAFVDQFNEIKNSRTSPLGKAYMLAMRNDPTGKSPEVRAANLAIYEEIRNTRIAAARP